ncbi:hypothetical protein [Autumnicola psychrophila]|uniref:Uncharacterized protein n=1 Tax=Autumnicola psychrophila TaxID=3075592 RepID=A0ABU3DUD8_9FLAO|nr:hypothetical protein [Zunongwangia sp. F225]MDT0687335.1 hypothetical protein [Zunongwangia sp. F225]
MKRTPFTISYWNGVRFPAAREGQTKWKAEIGDGVHDLYREALCPECSFSRNGVAMCSPGYENRLLLLCRIQNGLNFKDVDWEWSVPAFFLAGSAQWKL